jgi:hypothetical protein
VHKKRDRDQAIERMLRRLKPRAGSVPSGACLDADTIAAWADGGLTADELAAAGEHVSKCVRCQTMLVAVIRSSPAAAVREPWWRRRWTLGVLVPVTAAAAALMLWIAVPRDDHRGSIERAPARANASAPSSTAAREPQRDEPQALAERGPASAVADGKPQTRADESRNKAKQETSDVARELDRFSSVSGRRASGPLIVPPAALPPPASSPGAATANAVAPLRSAATALMAKDASAEIVSPDRSSRWRLRPAGSVEYSSDGGSTWQTLSTGISAELTAGASPSSSVCWLVGRGGTVLLSTDGRRFQRVAFPNGVDLIAISAADAQTATVTTADGRRFSTADGGLTWRQS